MENKMPKLSKEKEAEVKAAVAAEKKAKEEEIEVVATREGFYGQMRIKPGMSFKVQKFEHLGEWMKCKDSKIEEKRVQFLKDKKKAK